MTACTFEQALSAPSLDPPPSSGLLDTVLVISPLLRVSSLSFIWHFRNLAGAVFWQAYMAVEVGRLNRVQRRRDMVGGNEMWWDMVAGLSTPPLIPAGICGIPPEFDGFQEFHRN
jgi:hypothetical protein